MAGRDDVDEQVEKDLAALHVKSDKDVAALSYNLARLALTRGDQSTAEERLNRALKALQHQKNPPEGSLEATKDLLKKIHS